MGARHVCLAAAMMGLTAGVPAANAATLATFRVGNWSAGAYSDNQQTQFSYCAATASYKSGIYMTVIVNRSYAWGLSFSDPSWNLTTNQHIPVSVGFDGGVPLTGNAVVLSSTRALIPMAGSSALINAFRAAQLMTVNASGHTFFFRLDGTSRLMAELASCVQTRLAIERGESPPTFAASPSHPTIRAAAGSPSRGQDSAAELELAATRIATNLLLQAKLPNARLLSPSETPDTIKRIGVAWKSDAGMGAVELLPAAAGTDAQQIASRLIEADAATCKGDFASGRSSDLVDNTIITKAFTGCKDSDGTRTLRYFVLHHEGSDYVVYALASGNSAGQTANNSPLNDATFQAAAVKAAFSP